MGVRYRRMNYLCNTSNNMLTLTGPYFGIHARGKIKLEGEIDSLIYATN